MKKLIYIFPSYSTFIKKDVDFLSKKYKVKSHKHHWLVKKEIPLRFLQQFCFLAYHIFSVKAIIVMFGGYWSFLPALFGKMFRKPVYIILGGTDCVSLPALNYGSLRKKTMSKFIKGSYRFATLLLPVHESLVFSEKTYETDLKYKYQGYKHFFPNIKTPYKVIHNGFDFDADFEVEKINNTFVCVASISDMTRFKLKGIDLVFMMAEMYQECSFTIIGISESLINQLPSIPNNLNLLPFLEQNEIKKYLLRSEYVLQLSISEGFPNAICEAMLCKCIPIGTSVGAIPLIIKNTGYVIHSNNIKKIKATFDEILSLDEKEKKDLREAAFNRIKKEFPLSRREKQFFDVLEPKRLES